MTETETALETLPISILTGYLGSGKTTLLSRLLRHPGMERAAVVINEFGDVGLDGALIEAAEEEMVVLQSGCVCCSIRGDLVESLNRLYERRRAAELPAFERVLVETTGLADPASILHTLMNDAGLAARFCLDGVITTVDAVLGSGQLDRHRESVKQAAMADRIVLTKTDIAAREAVEALQTRLAGINPAAKPLVAISGDADPDALFGAGLYDLAARTADARRWINEEAYGGRADAADHDHECGEHCRQGHHHHRHAPRHDDGIRTFCLTAERPLAWPDVAEALDLLAQMHGEQLLRVKGLLNVADMDQPVVIHGVQHLFHPPETLGAWPDADRRSRVVFITHELDESRVRQVLEPFLPID